MNKKKIIGYTLIAILIIIQFIRPAKNVGESFSSNDIIHALPVPEELKKMMAASCFDCHSNHTNHLWYENIQPVGWWISSHITDGKKHLNFSEFNTYSSKKKAHKLEELTEMVGEEEMPLPSYLLVHNDSRLSEAQKQLLVDWARNGMKMFGGEEEKE